MSHASTYENPGTSPFDSSITFGENLNLFLREALEWMTGGEIRKLGESVHPIETGCWWGAALYLETFVSALRSYLNAPSSDKNQVPLRTLDEAKQLHGVALTLAIELSNHAKKEAASSRKSVQTPGARYSWEGVVYDTALIARSLLLFLRFEESLGANIGYSEDRRQESINLIDRLSGQQGILLSVLRWIRDRVDDWDLVKYHAGPQDWGMVLRLLALVIIDGKYAVFTQNYVDRKDFRRGRVAGDIGESVVWETNSVSFAAYIADRVLLEANESVASTNDGNSRNLINWGGTLSSSHVILGLAEILPHLKSNGRVSAAEHINGESTSITLFDRVVSALTRSVITLEHTQEKGNWGVPNETAIALQAYIIACLSLSEQEAASYTTVEPLEDVTFRAIRWLVDANQRFEDGSILHLTTYTAFYSHCLATVIAQSRMEFNEHSVTTIYDRVLWSIMGGSREERRKRLILNSRLIAAQNSGAKFRAWTNRIIDFFCISLFVCAVLLADTFELLIDYDSNGARTLHWGYILAFVPIVSGFIVALRNAMRYKSKNLLNFVNSS